MDEKYKNAKSLGERLYILREDHNLSQEELAEKLDVSRQTISNWENDKAKMDVVKAAEICRLYGISLDELILDEERSGEAPQPKKKKNTRLTVMLIALAAAVVMLITGIVFLLIPDSGEISSIMSLTALAGWGFAVIGGIAALAVIIVIIVKERKK